jgi:hypothetical protein
LRRSSLAGPRQSILHDTAFEHPDYQADHPLVSDAMPQKLDQPLMINLIKRYANLIPLSTTHLKID